MSIGESNPVEHYISMLVRGSGKITHTASPAVADSDNSTDEISVVANASNKNQAPSGKMNSATGKYLSVDICSFTCIIPVSEVLTVRRYSRGQIADGIQLLDPVHLFADSNKPTNEYRFMVILKAEEQVGLLTESLNGIVAIADNDLRWRRTAANKPWFKAVSTDSRHLLLDWRELQAMHTGSKQAKVLA